MSFISKIYLNETEASHRYGYSRQWFQRERWKGTGPSFIKVNSGRILYPIDTTDAWFKDFGLQTSTSMPAHINVLKESQNEDE